MFTSTALRDQPFNSKATETPELFRKDNSEGLPSLSNSQLGILSQSPKGIDPKKILSRLRESKRRMQNTGCKHADRTRIMINSFRKISCIKKKVQFPGSFSLFTGNDML
jgi:hypothetical protein